MEERELPSRSLQRKRERRIRRITMSIGLIFIILLAVVVTKILSEMTYRKYEITTEYDIDGFSTKFIKYTGGVIRYNNDGAEAVGINGKKIWNIAYSLENPKVVSSDDWALIYDVGGKRIYMTDGNGLSISLSVYYPIEKADISANGIAVLLLNAGETDYIQAYDYSGEKVYEINIVTKTSGYPMDISISQDGKKMVTSYFKMDEGKTTSYLTFYNFGEVGKNQVKNIVGQLIYDDFLIPDVEFVEKDALFAFGEAGFYVFEFEEKPVEIKNVQYSGNVRDITVGAQNVLILNDLVKDNVEIYDKKGKKIATNTISASYTGFDLGNGEYTAYSKTDMAVIRHNGSIKFTMKYDRELNGAIAAGKNRYMLLDGGKIQTIRLKLL